MSETQGLVAHSPVQSFQGSHNSNVQTKKKCLTERNSKHACPKDK